MNKIDMKKIYKNEVFRDGCVMSLYNPKSKKSTCVFKEDYEDSLIRYGVFMIAIFIFAFSLILALKFVGERFSVVYVLIQFIPLYILLVSPLIFCVLLQRMRYKRTLDYYELLQNDDLCLYFYDFSIELLSGDRVIRNVYYSHIE
ncbi:MAG: hypothetical protein K2G03_06590, partial [Bacilli bacterium]|nr:hypothetical protein [Bacilli bacterium]